MSDLYANPGSLFDVTTGNNGTCANSYLCTAAQGYDGPTGLGTPCGVSAFGNAFASPAGCGSPASNGSATLKPALQNPLVDYFPACRTAPPDYARCDAYYKP